MWLQLSDEVYFQGTLERTCNISPCRAEQLKGLVQPTSNVSRMHAIKRVSIVEDWLICISLLSQLRDLLSSSELHTKHSICLAPTYRHLMPHLPANGEELLSICPSWRSETRRATLLTRHSSSLYGAFSGIQLKYLSMVICGNYELPGI